MGAMKDETSLYRQIHPNNVQDGEPTSVEFRPKESDEGFLSTYNGELIDAEGSHSHYTAELKLLSCGAMSIIVSECIAEGLQADANGVPFKEHAQVDFNGNDKKKIRSLSKTLQACALKRGWQFRATS